MEFSKTAMRCLVYFRDVSKTSFVRCEDFKDNSEMSRIRIHYVWMSQKRLWYVVKISKTPLRCLVYVYIMYGCLKNVFCTLWRSQRQLWDVSYTYTLCMDVSKTSFVRCEDLKDNSEMSRIRIHYVWMSQKRLLYVVKISKTTLRCLVYVYIMYGCLKNVFCTLWRSQRQLWDVLYTYTLCMDVSKTSFVRCEDLKDNSKMSRIRIHYVWMSQKRLLYVVKISKTTLRCFVYVYIMYGCLKNVFCTLWRSQRQLWDVLYTYTLCMDVSKTSFVRCEGLKDNSEEMRYLVCYKIMSLEYHAFAYEHYLGWKRKLKKYKKPPNIYIFFHIRKNHKLM